MDITKLSETELKAMKADCYEAIALNQQNLQVINNELAKRNQPKEEAKPETKEGN